jgi:hypothetical protein
MHFITGRPALRATFKSTDGEYYNSFSDFPLSEREPIKEPLFSSTSSVCVETSPVTGYRFALDVPVEDSMAVSVKTFKTTGVNHDAAISLVKWNDMSDGKCSIQAKNKPQGLHLRYNAMCTDVYMNGSTSTTVDESTGAEVPVYTSTVYEYPHPCYGRLKTAGTGLPIFDGPFASDMTMDDLLFVNGYFVVKNYHVQTEDGKTDEEWSEEDERILESGWHPRYPTGDYPSGGYVVTNFFADTGEGSTIPSLYEAVLKESSRERPKIAYDSERFYDYSFLWHIKPGRAIEFYPESRPGVVWAPYYPSKYVDFIKYNNGRYYISLRSSKERSMETVGYDIVETDTLFREARLDDMKLERGVTVSGVGFFDDHVAVEYTKIDGNRNSERYVKWFEAGKPERKTLPVLYVENVSGIDPPAKRYDIRFEEDYSSNSASRYDNVEVINSLNRFTPVVNHKSNLFSIRLEDLGFEESEYLTDYQKKVLRTYFRNSITNIVDAVKPAHTHLFDVYMG